MIPSYQEEIRIRRTKDFVFWFVVAVMTVFLYFFFQGYYPNYERFLDRTDTSKQAFLKPFGIIDIHVFPSPDGIWVNNEYYNNNSKTIFDLGRYNVSIYKSGSLSVNYNLDITKRNPFYTNVINLLVSPRYSLLPIQFKDISVVDNLYMLTMTKTGAYLLTDVDFQVLHVIQTDYKPIGGLYFKDSSSNIWSYSLDTEKFMNVLDSETTLPVHCTDVSYYNSKLFCRDTMKFVGPKNSDIREKVLAINKNVAVTPKYIYNEDATNTSWRYFEYRTGTLSSPDGVVHINKIPYIFEKGSLSPLDKTDATIATGSGKENWGMDVLSQVRELEGETILLGEKDKKGRFMVMDTEKQYSGTFDFEHTGDVKVYKISGVYIFTTPKAAYVYYKGAKEIIKVLDNVDILTTVDSQIFFNKEGKNYVLDLLRKVK